MRQVNRLSATQRAIQASRRRTQSQERVQNAKTQSTPATLSLELEQCTSLTQSQSCAAQNKPKK